MCEIVGHERNVNTLRGTNCLFPCPGSDDLRCSLDIPRCSRMFFKRHKLLVPMSWVRCSLDILRCSRMFSRCSQMFEDVLQEAKIACFHVLGQMFEDVLRCSLTILRCSQKIFEAGTNSLFSCSGSVQCFFNDKNR